MILKALADGITEERIAETLDVNVAKIREKRNLLMESARRQWRS
jgi:hypothetical protein